MHSLRMTRLAGDWRRAGCAGGKDLIGCSKVREHGQLLKDGEDLEVVRGPCGIRGGRRAHPGTESRPVHTGGMVRGML